MPNQHAHITKGAHVEVTKPEPDSPYYPATVLKLPSKTSGQVYIEYDTIFGTSKRVREQVGLANVRPMLPAELNRCFKVGEVVDAYHDNGWWKGVVKDIWENSKYLVLFEERKREIEFERSSLRIHRKWVDGRWVPPLQNDAVEKQEKASDETVKPREFKLKVKFGKPEPKFRRGQMVEVSSDEDGYQGSWFSAKIVEAIGREKYLVEYATLKMDDESQPLREEAYERHIRPFPPPAQLDDYSKFDEVDAWYNEGWWVGVITKVLRGSKYVVYFSSTKEELTFEQHNLRRHLDWIDGQWIGTSVRESSDMVLNPKDMNVNREADAGNLHVKFRKGMEIEVTSDEAGYKGSWFSATIVELKENNTYLVEYETLKTDDETEFLKEEVDAAHIRPRPPKIQRILPFTMYEEVDAWYNEGWWEGRICRILDNLKYEVYFSTTNEILQFEHCDLRPHQEWDNGNWISFPGWTKI